MTKSSLSTTCAAALATLGFIGLAAPAHAWIYPEHRDIAVLAVEKLDPERRALFDRLWRDARTGHEQRLCEKVADSQQGVAPACIDWAAFPAIAGDHSCSSKNMLDNAVKSDWILQVADVAAQLKVDLGRIAVTARPEVNIRSKDVVGRCPAPHRGRGAARRPPERAAHVGHPAAARRRRIRDPRRIQQRALPAAAAAHRHHAEAVRRTDAQRPAPRSARSASMPGFT